MLLLVFIRTEWYNEKKPARDNEVKKGKKQ